jgi:hypothetical protein
MTTKTCKCGDTYTQYTTLQNKCPKCLAEQAKKKRVAGEKRVKKEFRKKTREMKEKVKTKAQWAKEAQAEFNRFIRLRDAQEPCISCGRYHQGQYHAGHYRSVGSAPELRFEESNASKQCQPCNSHLSGNIIEYRIRLKEKIGEEKLEWLEGPHEPKRYTIEDLKEIKAKYRLKCKELEEG